MFGLRRASNSQIALAPALEMTRSDILIPLSAAASRGDQILNANSFRSSGYSYVLEEEDVSNTALLEAIEHVFKNRDSYIEAMQKNNGKDSIETIVELIIEASEMR